MSFPRKLTQISDARFLLAAVLFAAPAVAAPKAAKRAPAAARPAPVVSIKVEPASAVLDGPKSRQQLLVTGVRSDGTLVDLTAKAKYAAKSAKVARVSDEGVVTPVGDGAATITVSAAGKSATAKVGAKNVRAPF